jgi:hypothetical protein
MLQHFLNPLMLLGLAGLSLPVLVHLISKRRYDVVEWGAMQFLELGKNARRKLRLEQLLLMLLRIGLVALVVFALARPWVRGGLFTALAERNSRDIVLVVDGSYSMGWQGDGLTPHQAAVRWAHRLIDGLQGGDTVMLIDARDRVRTVIGSPVSDLDHVREQLDRLPPPSGSSDLPGAVHKAITMLHQGTNAAREVVVLSDGQALGWRADDEVLWARVDDALQQARFKPRLWSVDVTTADRDGQPLRRDRTNYAVDRLELSRELSVPGFPVRVETKVNRRGGEGDAGEARRTVHFEVDGQRLADQRRTVVLPPGGEASVEFEYRFTTPGSHLIGVALDDDPLPGDNRAAAAVTVADAVPVLLVDGDPSLEPTKGETFFVKAALTPSLADSPLVRADVVRASEFDPAALTDCRVVLLADVPRLDAAAVQALAEFVERGGGLMLAPGDRCDADEFNHQFGSAGADLAPADLDSVAAETDPKRGGVRVANASLDLSWLAPQRQENGGALHTARFQKWWRLKAESGKPKAESGVAEPGSELPLSAFRSPLSVTVARLESTDPLLVLRRHGAGQVLLFASPLDLESGWNTLAARRDAFVPLMHEVVFHLTAERSGRNVESGLPLVAEIPPDAPAAGYVFLGPGDTQHPPTPQDDPQDRPRGGQLLRLSEPPTPGVYRLVRRAGGNQDGHNVGRPEYFVVNFDRGESDLTPLDEMDRLALERDGRIAFLESRAELLKRLYDDAPQAELYRYLMLVFLVILVAEVVMTRRLVRGGHAEIEVTPNDADPADTDAEPEEVRDSLLQPGRGGRM